MPIYHFNLADHVREVDVEGTDLPGLQTARTQAVIYAAEVLHDTPEIVWGGRPFAVEVTDDAGKPLFAVHVEVREAA